MRKDIDISEKLTKLGNMISDYRPLFIFSINFFPFLSILCEKLGIIYVAESVDCPVFEIFHTSIRNKVNRVFLFDRQQYLSVQSENPGYIFHLPLGAPCERTQALLGDDYKPEYDISFIGSLYKEKDLFFDLKLPKAEKERFVRIMKEQIAESGSGMKYSEERIDEKAVSLIKNAAKEFYPSDSSVKNMDRFVALNDYIAPHIAFLERVDILNDIADSVENAKVHLFTRSDTSDISRKVKLHGGVKSLEEMPFVFRNSKINLNISLRSIQTGIPQRVWDVLACRGFLITNDQEEIKDYFTPGVHLETYSSRDELKEKVRYYLEHEDERLRIAQAGFDEVQRGHTVLLRAAEMIKRAFS
ncbi:glycosyltransferase family protein [Butyrivibrio sp. YAB3001]|uniref:glycosyltransferase family protein n=1 Tax=Butyrivibrio sp. YAB3001 TaxID=1520812 RepID=UPI001587FD16|nr:glycosyltransferase [Butyrivibrio sp. YAB3001]